MEVSRNISSNKGILKAAFMVGGIGLLSKPLALLRDILMAAVFGTDHRTDAYLIGASLPNLFVNLLTGGAFTSAFIPTFTGYLAKEKEADGWRMASSILNNLLLISIGFIILGILFFPTLIRILAPGFDPKTLSLGTALGRFLLPVVVLFALAHILKCILNSYKQFLLPAMGPLLLNLSFIGAILLLAGRFGVYALGIGLLFGPLLHSLIQSVGLRKRFSLYKPILRREGWGEFTSLFLPFIPWMILVQMNGVIDRCIASTLGEGNITALHFASRVNEAGMALFGASMATAAFPYLSDSASIGRWEDFSQEITTSMRMLLFITLPISMIVVLYSTPIIRLIYERGSFDPRSTHLTSIALLFYGIGLPAMASKKLLIRGYFAARSPKGPIFLGMICVALNLFLSLILSRVIGIGGIALATSISEITLFFLLINSLSKFGTKTKWLFMFLVSIVMISMVSVLLPYPFVSRINNQVASPLLGIILSGTLYILFSLLFGFEEPRKAMALILKR